MLGARCCPAHSGLVVEGVPTAGLAPRAQNGLENVQSLQRFATMPAREAPASSKVHDLRRRGFCQARLRRAGLVDTFASPIEAPGIKLLRWLG